jgi:transposase
MSSRLLPDELWNEIEVTVSRLPIVAGGRPTSEGCSHRVDGRLIRIEDGHRLEGPASGGIWCFLQDVHATARRVDRSRHLATDPRAVPGQAAWGRRVGLVTSACRLQLGKGSTRWTKTGPNPTDRGRSGSKHCLLTDAGGVPLVVQTVPANQHDVTTLLPLVTEMPAVAGKPGRPKQKPDMLVADKAFDDKSLRHLLHWLGIEPQLPVRGKDHQGLGIWRWFVERTISWLHQFRRLRIRWDRRPEIHQAFLSLAAGIICYRIWIKEF